MGRALDIVAGENVKLFGTGQVGYRAGGGKHMGF